MAGKFRESRGLSDALGVADSNAEENRIARANRDRAGSHAAGRGCRMWRRWQREVRALRFRWPNSTVQVFQGQSSVTVNAHLTRSGSTGTVALTVSGLPQGATDQIQSPGRCGDAGGADDNFSRRVRRGVLDPEAITRGNAREGPSGAQAKGSERQFGSL
jgi:hypothetical protein